MTRNLFFLLILLPLSGQADVSIVTSIKPLHQLTKIIMQGAGDPKLLIKRQISPHEFAFKPSHFRLLQNADLVIWIDRQFESSFQQLPQILRAGVTQLELLPRLGLQQQDGHIWYSPVLLIRMTRLIRDALSKVDPKNSEIYLLNARHLTEAIQTWRTKFKPEIEAAKPRYILDHDFLSHFENDMGIVSIAVLHDTYDQSAGIRALQIVEEKLEQLSNVCLLTNEATASKLARNLAEKFSLKIYTIDQSYAARENMPTIIQALDQLREVLTNC
ncbi:MAG: zinc ABC transporter substrate-binding protein [Proteobacteria bacterium]|nr:zinc ABC transporter substrate-binding protein [Pseudomonadota bacterium]